MSKMETLLTTKEVCEVLQCHPNSVRNWIHSGKLKCAAVVGRSYRFRRADIEAFMRSTARPQLSTVEIAEINESTRD